MDTEKTVEEKDSNKDISLDSHVFSKKNEHKKHFDIKKGDIFYADLGETVGCEQKGMRPVVIIQNNVGNKYSPTVIVAAITSSMRKTSLPVHIEISAQESNLPFESIILLEQVRTIDKSRLKYKISSLRHEFIHLIDEALKVSFEID